MIKSSPVCKKCVGWKRFGEKCWYFWENKKACTQHIASDFDEPKFHEANE